MIWVYAAVDQVVELVEWMMLVAPDRTHAAGKPHHAMAAPD